jgi:hypothetical protein
VKESILHYIWQYKLFTTTGLQTTDGELVEVIDTGKPNSDAGPDFFNAKIKIGDTLWAGNVEIHTYASDWNSHQHSSDKAYKNTILHVVKYSDIEIYRADGGKIPQIELNYPAIIDLNYESLHAAKLWIPCAAKIHTVPSILITSWKTALLTERLEQKTTHINELLAGNTMNFEEAFYISLAKSYGFGTNGEVFEALARSLPLAILAKHKNNLFQIEALLFGQSGLLREISSDDYESSLCKEFNFLKTKYDLKPIDGSRWKLLRMRPVNFPYVRIAQFAALIHHSIKLFSKITENPELKYISKLFETETSEYWKKHYHFGKTTHNKIKKIGISSVYSIIINTVVPFLFTFADRKGNQELKDKAFALLAEIPAENNVIVSGWKTLNINVENAVDSQALIHLKKNYCDDKKCLRCRIGLKVLTV